MRTRLSLKFLAIVIVCGVAACHEPQNRPPGPSPIPNPNPGPQPSVSRLELDGQPTLAPGATSEFTLIAVAGDGTRTDVTSSAQWSTRNSAYVASLGQGRIRAVAIGDAFLDARYSNRIASREIIVVPDGTFRVTGRIVEGDATTPVANAHIRVRDREESGLATDTDTDGYYRLFGVRPETDFVVTRPGYAETERRVTIDKHSTVNIAIALTGPRLNAEGTYTATFDWSNCGNGFHDDLRHRAYTAVVKQSGAQIEVRFTEPSFVSNSANRGNLMEGRVDPNGIYLFADLGYYYWYYGPPGSPFLTELLPDSYRLVTWGTAFLSQSGNRFSGTIQGGAQLYRRVSQNDTFIGGCSTGNVSFERR